VGAVRRRAQQVLLGAVCAALASLCAGCGSGASGTSTAPGSAQAGVMAARAELARFRSSPSFIAPGPAFMATARVRGKQIFEIPITSSVPFVAAVEQGMRQAASLVGAKLTVFPNEGQPSQWAQGISTAIAQRASAIVLFAQDPQLVGPQIAQAQRAGIPVIVLRTTGEGEACPGRGAGAALGTTCVPGPFEQAGRLEADAVISQSGGRADVLMITSNDARSTRPLVRALAQEFRLRCPACRTRNVDVPIPQWADRIATEVRSALVRDPEIDYVIPIYDSMSQFAVPAIAAAGASARVKIATFNGTPFVLKLLQNRDVVATDVGESLAWIGWASMDQVFRVLSGVPPARSEHTPVRVFDASNVAEAGNPPQFDTGYGDAYVEGYRKLWGASK
jgi:ribose transport system substrate-binding protein